MRRRIAAALATVALAAVTLGATFTALCGNGTSCAYNGTEPRPGYQTFEKIRTNFNDHETRILAAEGLAIRKVTVSFTDAQVKTLPTSALTLLAAPGSGLTIVPDRVLLFAKFAAGAYTNVDAAANMWVQLGSQSWSSYIANDASATPALGYMTTFKAAVNRRWVFREWTDATDPTAGWGSIATPLNFQENQALTLVLSNGSSGNLTGGNGSNGLTAVVFYSVVAVP